MCCVRFICCQYVLCMPFQVLLRICSSFYNKMWTPVCWYEVFFLLFKMVHIAREGCNKNTSVNYRRKQIIRIHVKDMIHNYVHLFAWFNNFFFIIIIPIWESCFISDVLIFPEQDFGFFFYLSSSSGQNSSKKRSNLIKQ